MLTGAVPFNGRTPMEVAYKHVHEPVEPPSKRRAGLSPALDALVLHALAKPVAERIRNADEFLSSLDALERAPPSTSPPAPPKPLPAAPSRRSALVVGALAATALGVALAWRTPNPVPAAGPSNRPDASTTSAEPSGADVAPRALDGASVAPDAPVTDAPERPRLDGNGAVMDSAGARRTDRVAVAPNAATDPLRADGAAVELSSRDVVPSVAPLLPDAAPRSPDDGLKQTPYGSHRAR
jgi:serine/threonine-protein kinase